MRPSLSNQHIIDLLKSLPDNNILYSFVKKIESLINNHNNNDTIINIIDKTYSIILIIITTYGKQTTIRLNDNEDDKKFKSFQKQYITYFDDLKKSKRSNLIYNIIDLETILYSKNTKNKLNNNDKLIILSNVYNFTKNFESVFNDQLYSDQMALTSNNEDEISYCYCNRPFNGEDMIACDNPDCEIEWFHLSCINLQSIPKNKWYCKECVKKNNKILPHILIKPTKRSKKFVETRGRKKKKIETRGRKKGTKNKISSKNLV